MKKLNTQIQKVIIYNEKNYTNEYFNIGNCMRLKKWNRALYISLAISFVFLIVCTVLQIINKEKVQCK